MNDQYQDLIQATQSPSTVKGYTHNFYRYPARFSNKFVRQALSMFSEPGDHILDPFMGGGTTIVEALSMGRFATGIDLNELAHFVATVKTAPLNESDQAALYHWLDENVDYDVFDTAKEQGRIVNLPQHLERLFGGWISRLELLSKPRQRAFMRCALLKTGQWAIDCRERIPSYSEIRVALREHVQEMCLGLNQLVSACHESGIARNKITSRRKLWCRSAVGIEKEDCFINPPKRFRLVLTSPPYYGVYVIFHRWQVKGRRERPAPYWIANLNDGAGLSHYTFGSRRTKLGREKYFDTLLKAFRSVKEVIHPKATIIQLVSFEQTAEQLPLYLETMQAAGYQEMDIFTRDGEQRIWRKVPHRKWYSRARKEEHDSMKEVLLLHRPT